MLARIDGVFAHVSTEVEDVVESGKGSGGHVCDGGLYEEARIETWNFVLGFCEEV